MLARQRVLDFGPQQHFEALHGRHAAAVALATKDGQGHFEQRLYAHDVAGAVLPELARSDSWQTYLSQSGFREPDGRRTVRAVSALTSVFVDLDSYKVPALDGLDPDAVLDHVLQVVPWLPMPTLLQSSGRGCYFVWTFSNVVGFDRLADWQQLEDALVRTLQPFGGDWAARDAARILKASGSIHLATGERATARQVGDVFEFEALRREVLQHAPLPATQNPNWRASVSRKVAWQRDRTAYTLAAERMTDYATLAGLRAVDGLVRDYRHRLLYCYSQAATWYCTSPDSLREELVAFAETHFANPERYRPDIVQSVTDRFDQQLHLAGELNVGRYKFTNRYILRMLEVTPAEQRQMRVVIGSDEKYRRRVEARRARGMMSREQYQDRARDRRSEARRMRSDGLSVADIATHLGVSLISVRKYLQAPK
jgi:DNA-binding NarL/FixJ family response regulator